MNEKTIVVIDDFKDIGEILEVNLKNRGYMVGGIFTDTSTAKESTEWKNVGCIFLDMNLNGGYGESLELARWINENFPEINIYLFTGADEIPGEFYRFITRVLKKPLSFDKLIEVIPNG